MPLSKRNVQPIDPLLTQMIVQYSQDKTYFIADKIFPTITTGLESGTYYTFSSSKDLFALPDKTERAPGTVYGRGQLGIGDSTYRTKEDGWEIPVDDRIQSTALAPYNPRRSAAESAAEVVMLRREKRVIDAITNTTTFASYTTALTGNNRWDDENSDPISAVDSWSETIRGNCGRKPNTMVLAYDTWLKIKEHPDILARIKITNDTILTVDLLKQLFGLERLLISMASYNSAEEGQTVSLSDMLSKKIFLAYVTPAPDLMRPSVGYTIQRNGLQAKTYREEQTNSEIARTSVNEVHKIVAADCGYLVTTVIS